MFTIGQFVTIDQSTKSEGSMNTNTYENMMDHQTKMMDELIKNVASIPNGRIHEWIWEIVCRQKQLQDRGNPNMVTKPVGIMKPKLDRSETSPKKSTRKTLSL